MKAARSQEATGIDDVVGRIWEGRDPAPEGLLWARGKAREFTKRPAR